MSARAASLTADVGAESQAARSEDTLDFWSALAAAAACETLASRLHIAASISINQIWITNNISIFWAIRQDALRQGRRRFRAPCEPCGRRRTSSAADAGGGASTHSTGGEDVFNLTTAASATGMKALAAGLDLRAGVSIQRIAALIKIGTKANSAGTEGGERFRTTAELASSKAGGEEQNKNGRQDLHGVKLVDIFCMKSKFF